MHCDDERRLAPQDELHVAERAGLVRHVLVGILHLVAALARVRERAPSCNFPEEAVRSKPARVVDTLALYSYAREASGRKESAPITLSTRRASRRSGRPSTRGDDAR